MNSPSSLVGTTMEINSEEEVLWLNTAVPKVCTAAESREILENLDKKM